jgi:hypothetical protein
MRRRLILGLAVLLYLASLLITPAQPAAALDAWFEKGKSDCASVDAAITLTYTTDDTGSAENRDFFRRSSTTVRRPLPDRSQRVDHPGPEPVLLADGAYPDRSLRWPVPHRGVGYR